MSIFVFSLARHCAFCPLFLTVFVELIEVQPNPWNHFRTGVLGHIDQRASSAFHGLGGRYGGGYTRVGRVLAWGEGKEKGKQKPL